jgi:hypothetical protein
MPSPTFNPNAYVIAEHIHQKAKMAKDLGGGPQPPWATQ